VRGIINTRQFVPVGISFGLSAWIGEYMLVDINTCFGTSPKKRVRYADGVTAARMFDEPGRVVPTTQEVDWSLDNLLGIIDQHHVDLALTYSLRGKLYDFVTGNDETWRAAQTRPQLVPIATIDPRRHFGCLEEVERCADRGFRICRFFPDEQGWALDSLPFLHICEALAEYELAIMLPTGGWGQQSRIAELLCPFGVPVVALGATFTVVAESIAVAAAYDNFFCDTSAIHTVESIEGFAQAAGAHKLMFGSNSPASYFESAYDLVEVAQTPDQEKSRVFGGNALRYLRLEGRQ